jgi:hypothetical protein
MTGERKSDETASRQSHQRERDGETLIKPEGQRAQELRAQRAKGPPES